MALTSNQKLAQATPAYEAAEKNAGGGQTHPVIEFASSGRGVALMELHEGQMRVVHNGVPGKYYPMVGDLAISSDGKRVAHVAHHNEKFRRIVVDGHEGPLFTDIGMPKFTPDGRHLLYTATMGQEERLVVDQKVIYDYNVSQDFLVSPDSQFIAFTAKAAKPDGKRFVITDLAMKNSKVFAGCGEWFTASGDLSRIAVACKDDSGQRIAVVDFMKREQVATINVPDKGQIVRRHFAADNRTFLLSTLTDDLQRYLYLNGQVAKIPAGEEIMSDPILLANPERIGVVIGSAVKVQFYTAFAQTGYHGKAYGYISDLTVSKDGLHHAFVAIPPGGQERMKIVVDGNEGPMFDKIVSPVFSPDGRYLVYRARQDGRRFLVVSDLKGVVVRQHPAYDKVFQPVFIENGASVAYGVQDGKDLWWKVEKL